MNLEGIKLKLGASIHRNTYLFSTKPHATKTKGRTLKKKSSVATSSSSNIHLAITFKKVQSKKKLGKRRTKEEEGESQPVAKLKRTVACGLVNKGANFLSMENWKNNLVKFSSDLDRLVHSAFPYQIGAKFIGHFWEWLENKLQVFVRLIFSGGVFWPLTEIVNATKITVEGQERPTRSAKKGGKAKKVRHCLAPQGRILSIAADNQSLKYDCWPQKEEIHGEESVFLKTTDYGTDDEAVRAKSTEPGKMVFFPFWCVVPAILRRPMDESEEERSSEVLPWKLKSDAEKKETPSFQRCEVISKELKKEDVIEAAQFVFFPVQSDHATTAFEQMFYAEAAQLSQPLEGRVKQKRGEASWSKQQTKATAAVSRVPIRPGEPRYTFLRLSIITVLRGEHQFRLHRLLRSFRERFKDIWETFIVEVQWGMGTLWGELRYHPNPDEQLAWRFPELENFQSLIMLFSEEEMGHGKLNMDSSSSNGILEKLLEHGDRILAAAAGVSRNWS
nr:beta-amylase 3, chloroplastic [Ipomoea batatas]